MHWKNIKDKVLIFGEDDYVFADMFVSIINEYDKIVTNDDLRRYTVNSSDIDHPISIQSDQVISV
ncbi:hypothetical protein [Chryseobacterium indoltheticum]|uniref:Uncharacterized protein n=1 Tax=Chryseobacterium indoltheticum TaxID=254 RepID=A0A381FPJ2_9FLAO|nr:hypothetical protein [Chryseobacterium indoltheticum]SUX48469.1 Uncharacterised protein [Chryseobacterium indoltheticum]